MKPSLDLVVKARLRRSSYWLAVTSSLALNCAHISVTEEVREYPGSELSQRFGSGQVKTDHVMHGRWLQLGSRLIVEIELQSQCRELIHESVTQEIRTVRRAGTGLAWDIALALGLSGFASFALVKPLQFGGTYYANDGRVVQSSRQGYTIGGIFAVLGAMMVGATVIDFVRAKDTVQYVDAFRPVLGTVENCDQERVAWANQSLSLNIGKFTSTGVSDAEGRVSLALPDESSLPAGVVVGSLAVVPSRAVPVDFRVPYAPGIEVAHTGQATWDSITIGPEIKPLVRE